MQTWLTLAAKHATLASGIGLGAVPAAGWNSLDGVAVGFLLAGAGFAAVNSSRQVKPCAILPVASAVVAKPELSRAEGGTLTRVRRRMDGLLTSMLSDDEERLHSQLPVLVRSSSVPGPLLKEPRKPEPLGEWPYLTVVRHTVVRDTVVRDTDDESGFATPLDTREPADEGEEAFWGPKPAQAASAGSATDVRADQGTTGSTRSRAGRRPAPRHAAPSAGFGVTIGRRLVSPRLTSRSAAHAG